MTDDAVQMRAPGASTTPPCNTSDGPREISHLVKSCKTWFCQEELCWRQLIWPGDDYVRTVVLPGHDIVSVDKPVVWRFCTSCATRYGRPLPPRAPVQVLEEESDAEPRYTLEEARQLLAPAMILPPATEPPPPPPAGTGEPRYTLAEARKVLAEQNCDRIGHDLDQLSGPFGTVAVGCSRCPAVFEPPVLPAVPPSDEVRVDVYRAGGHSSLRLTHTPTGIVAEASSGRPELEKREQAMLLLRARLLVARLEREGNG